MAGAYPDVPGKRMAYDVDGSVPLITADPNTGKGSSTPGGHDSQAWRDMTTEEREGLNGEDFTYSRVTQSFMTAHWLYGVVFPEDREVDGLFWACTNWNTEGGQDADYTWSAYSLNSTNGMDGSWSDMLVDPYDVHYPAMDSYRTQITSKALTGVTSVKLNFAYGTSNSIRLFKMHIYGTITPGQTPDRIIFLDAENADIQFTKVLDYGDVPRGQTQVRQVKLKNNSTTKTINTIQVTAEDIYGGAGSWYTFSADGVSYQATYPVGNLGPGGTKLLYVKQIVPDAEPLGPHSARIRSAHASVT